MFPGAAQLGEVVAIVQALLHAILVEGVTAAYARLIKSANLAIDDIHGKPDWLSKLKVVCVYYINVGSMVPATAPLPLAEEASPHVPGLMTTWREGANKAATSLQPQGGVVVGTIRMGYGHHRIAYATTSWALGMDKKTYFHDLLNLDSEEASLIKTMDHFYSQISRIQAEFRAIELVFGYLMANGATANLARQFAVVSAHFRTLTAAFPRDTPIISCFPYVGLSAVAAGFTRVINLVFDNHAQAFHIVPGAINLIQGPTMYHEFLQMGVDPKDLKIVGHWIPRELVVNIKSDCNARKARAAARKPTRVLCSVGGAGAQKTFVCELIRAMAERIARGSAQLLLNAGDHTHMHEAFANCLDDLGIRYTLVDTLQGVHDFCGRMSSGLEPERAVTIFAFNVYFPAVATTDILCRVSDVLACKPGELAFYPVPKLMLRRVGDHEFYSALRASEVGDGTQELREVSDVVRYLDIFAKSPDALTQMNDSILTNASVGMYDGCKAAVEMATAKL
mmetsp:Transcript_6824/g.19812  ORF Transcript_6824/g.19812 Transcript_6824/m.19812 type:complete len:508 (-) Transcript_6824:444-1967(-)